MTINRLITSVTLMATLFLSYQLNELLRNYRAIVGVLTEAQLQRFNQIIIPIQNRVWISMVITLLGVIALIILERANRKN